MHAHAAGLAPGTRLDRYTLIRRFAMGGMAELYLAQQAGAAGFSKLVALKRILPHLAADHTFTQMFLGEARLASDLSHPNLAHVLDFGEADGEHFLTMEYVHGANLLEALKRARRPLPLEAALQIVMDVARGLHELHEHRSTDGRPLGLVHRDVSPSNVLLAYDGSVKLTDFGIAKAMELTSATRTGTFKGKLGHSSPEQARGEQVDRRSDVFCLGILLYEVTTGVRAFSGPNEFAVLGKVARAKYDPPQSMVDGYPAALSELVAAALCATPEGRPETAAEFAESLAAFARAESLATGPASIVTLMRSLFGEPPPIAETEELERATRTDMTALDVTSEIDLSPRRPWLAYALIPAALLLGAAGAWFVRAPEAARSARPMLTTVDAPPAPLEPVTVAKAGPEPTAEPESEETIEVQPEAEPAPKKPVRKKRRRSSRRGPSRNSSKPASSKSQGVKLDGALFPPDL